MVKLYTDLSRSTTDEMNDLDPILVLKHRRAPVVAAHDGPIQFDGNPRRGQIKLRD
jgi:hypothetical protein